MNRFLQITKATFLQGFNVNRKKGNQKSAFSLLIIFSIIFLVLSFLYHFEISSSMAMLGVSPEEYLVVTLLASAMLTFMISIYQMQGTIFQTKDYELLESLPISKPTIVAAKIAAVYLINFFEDLIIVLPGLVFYMVYGGTVVPLIFAIISTFFVSMIPLLVSSLIGTFIAYVTAKTKHKSLVTVIAYLIFFIAIFGVSFMIGNTVGGSSISISAGTLPYFTLLLNSFTPGQEWQFFVFILIHIVSFALVVTFISFVYRRINTLMRSNNSNEKYVNDGKGSLSYTAIINKKERDMVFNKPMYLVNSYLGPVFFLLISIMMLIISITVSGEIAAEGPEEVALFNSIMCSTVVMMALLMNGMMSSTTFSFSLEGENMELLHAYPIDPNDIIKAKLRLGIVVPVIMNLVISSIVSIIYTIFMGFDPLFIVAVIIFPILASVTTAYVGLLCGMRWPKIHFENEMQVMKNSACANFTMLFVALPSFLLGGVYFVCAIFGILIIAIPVIAAFYITAIIVSRYILKKHGVSLYYKITQR